MTTASFDRLLRSSRFAMPAIGRDDALRADRAICLTRPDRDQLEGKIESGRAGGSGGATKVPGLSRQLDKRMPMHRFGVGQDSRFTQTRSSFDKRQRAIVKVHYFNHAAGGGAALGAHARYVARDAATRDDLAATAKGEQRGAPDREAESEARAHASYLTRDRQAARLVFYDAAGDGVDGAARAEIWAKSDKRHFRIVLSAENGARLNDLPAYTREVMARAEVALGTKLQWVAVDHWDTAHPHTHLIIRGRRANGQDLVIPRDFIRYGFHTVARDVATEWLGARSPADERRALDREVTRHAPTRLDRMLATQLPADGAVRLANIEAPNGDPHMTRALKNRARELQRMGLATEVKRNVLAFNPDWRDRLNAMELHLDTRKRLMHERTLRQAQQLNRGRRLPDRDLLGR